MNPVKDGHFNFFKIKKWTLPEGIQMAKNSYYQTAKTITFSIGIFFSLKFSIIEKNPSKSCVAVAKSSGYDIFTRPENSWYIHGRHDKWAFGLCVILHTLLIEYVYLCS
jgi:hypothetical protein